MAVTVAAFRVQFPEFTNTNADQLQAHLDAAELEIDREVWGAKGDQGQMYLAAHKLSLSPFGNNAELAAKGGETSYEIHYAALVRQIGEGILVL